MGECPNPISRFGGLDCQPGEMPQNQFSFWDIRLPTRGNAQKQFSFWGIRLPRRGHDYLAKGLDVITWQRTNLLANKSGTPAGLLSVPVRRPAPKARRHCLSDACAPFAVDLPGCVRLSVLMPSAELKSTLPVGWLEAAGPRLLVSELPQD